MQYIIPPFIEKLRSNLLFKNNLLQVILGPRQIGKTTSILRFLEKEMANSSHFISADELFSSSPHWIIENWQLAVREKKVLVIDEIQKCENWSETVKVLWDEVQRKKISFTGKAAVKPLTLVMGI